MRRAGGGVIDALGDFGAFLQMSIGATGGTEARLKLHGVFAQIMPEPGETGPVGGVERFREFCCEVCHGVEMPGAHGVAGV